MNETLEGLRVLLVEDEALLAEELSVRLSRLGLIPLTIVDTGKDAVEAALELKPDLILMDIRLKGSMDGVHATEVITSLTSIPTVFLTAHSDRETLSRAKAAQPYGYVLKPYNERDLIVTLEMAMLRHRLYRQVRASEKRYSATLASIGDGVIAIGPEGLLTYINPVAEELTGWSLEEARDRPIGEVLRLYDETTDEPIDLLLNSLSLSQPIRNEAPMVLVTRRSEKIPVDAAAAPIRDEASSGNLGAVLAMQDLREKRKVAEKLRKAKKQLQLAQRMEAIARLSGGLAHDFNNLLTVICCHAELLLYEEELSESSREMVDEIQRAGRQGAAITRQLLSFCRQQIVQPVPVSMGLIINEVAGVLNRLLGQNVELSIWCDDTLAPILADPRQLEQILLNLAINARDAMPGGGKLDFCAENVTRSDADGPRVKLTVADTGSGIPRERLSKIFEPLYTTKEAGKGSGLGLATVQAIMDECNGRIEVSSRPGEGTSFVLYFPALPPNSTSISDNGELSLAKDRKLNPPLSSGTVLVVDDQPTVRASVSAVLTKQGFEVLTADGGDEAERLFSEHREPISLVITDVEMPLVSGQELAGRLRAMHPDVKVLFLSGHTRDSLMRKRFLEGKENFLQKPFGVSELVAKVQECLALEQ
jgi:two-component system, cell cycle sensor histidine kinase and response regulator CckA